MRSRVIVVVLLAFGVLGTALGFSAARRGRASGTSGASVANVVTGRGAEPSTPTAAEVEEPVSLPSPVLTY